MYLRTAAIPLLETDLEPVSCPLCGADDATPFVEAFDRRRTTATAFQLVRCARCTLVYQNPRVHPRSIGKYYGGDYHKSREGRREAGRRPVPREQRKRQIVESFGLRQGTVLDVGCANGDFLLEMRDHGWAVQGVEHSPEAAAFCREQRGIQVAAGDLLDRPEDGTRFDLITLWAVLPHLPEPLATMRHAASLLTPGGVVLVCVANIDSWASRIGRRHWGHLDQPRHYCMYGPNSLRRLFAESGLEVGPLAFNDSLWKSQILIPPAGLLLRRLSGMAPSRPRNAMLRCMALGNNLLAAPIEALGRRLRRGGMITTCAKAGHRE